MTLLNAIILGIVEGITEFLPISSTGHLILTSRLLQISQSEFVKSFEIAIQLGAIAAVVFLYWRAYFTNANVLKKIIIAFIPTGIIGLAFYKIVKTYLLASESVVLWALLLGGVVLIIFELWHKEKPEATDNLSDITYKQAFTIGLFQAVAIIPGVSRAAATIVGGLVMGLKRKTIVEFSFLLAAPTMMAATGLDLLKSGANFTSYEFLLLLVGTVVSFLVAMVAIKFLLSFIKNHTFIPFGIYRIVIALIFAAFLFAK